MLSSHDIESIDLNIVCINRSSNTRKKTSNHFLVIERCGF